MKICTLARLLLALAVLVPAGRCGTPSQQHSRSPGAPSLASEQACEPAGATCRAAQLALARSGQHAAAAAAPLTTCAQPEVLQQWTGSPETNTLAAVIAGILGAACGAGTLLLWQKAQRRRRRRQARCKHHQLPPQQLRRLRPSRSSQAVSPWANRRASLADSLPRAAKRPPLPPAPRQHSLPALPRSLPLEDGVLARVSRDAPSLSLNSPFASCASQHNGPSQSMAPSPFAGLPPISAAACTAAAELAMAETRGALPARPSLASGARSASARRPSPSHQPAFSPSVRPSMEGCPTPSRLPSAPSRHSIDSLPSTGALAAALHASSALSCRHSHTLPAVPRPAADAGQEEQPAAQPLEAAPLHQSQLPSDWPAPLDAGALPEALRRCLVHPSEISFLQWPEQPLQPLGAGASATVFRAQLRGCTVAVKVMNTGHSAETQQAFIAEAVRMQQLQNEHIVAFLGVSLDGPNAMLIMEYCPGRDLFSSLQLHTDDGSGQRLFGWRHRGRRVALHLARALAYLHSLGIVHMDVKSSNELLTGRGGAKLGDVGLSRSLEGTHLSAVTCVGTFAWAAPEVLLGGHDCGRPADIYSFGVVLWELVTGERPVRGQLRLPRAPEECPQEVHDLMLRCLGTDPQARPTASQLVLHLEAMAHLEQAASPAAASTAATPAQQ
ncbi:hypothetical protein ABPG75_002491 [Micractinium tetrahymenae]